MIKRSPLTTATIVSLLLALVLMVAACGAATPTISSESVAQPPAPTEAPAEPTEEAAQPTEETAPTEEPIEAAEGEELTITHAQGETIVARNPETVLVFDYSVLDTLDQLGVDVTGVPQGTAIPPFLEKYANSEYQNVGSLFEPDYEKVNDLQPDLIIVAGRSSTVYPQLAEIAPTIDLTLDQTTWLEDFKSTTTTLGEIFSKEEEVEARLAEIDESIARVQGLAEASGETALITLTTGGEVTAYGSGSRFGLIHDILGVTPVVEDIEEATHGDAISFEFILEHNPDILYIVDRDSAIGEEAQSAAEIMDNELIHATNAWTNDKLVYLDAATWYLANAGLGSVASMIAEIEASLQ